MDRLNSPTFALKTAYWILFIFGGFNIIVGLLAYILNISVLLQAGVGIFSILFGVAFLVLGYFAQRRSVIALSLQLLFTF
jgi:hypothetical protein